MKKVKLIKFITAFSLLIFLSGCSNQADIGEELVGLGYELNENNYEMRLDYDTDMFLVVEDTFDKVSVKSNNAEIILNADGSISCSETLGGNCEDAKTTTGLFSLGQQIRVTLQNVNDNASYRNSYIETINLLDFDMAEVNEIVNFSNTTDQ